MKYVLLGVEGPHDQAAVGKLLKIAKFRLFNGKPKHLDSFWEKLVPAYPPSSLYGRFNMPSIYQSDVYSVAIYQGEGSNLTVNLQDILATHAPYYQDIAAFGIVVDADNTSPASKAQEFADTFRGFFPNFPSTPGIVSAGTPRTGVYVLPDNVHQGTLDTLLVQCGDVVYPDLKSQAQAYLDHVDKRYTQHWRPFDSLKALVATMTSVLKPGATNTASIAQNAWIGPDSLANIPELAALQRFLQDLLDIGETP